MSNTQLEF